MNIKLAIVVLILCGLIMFAVMYRESEQIDKKGESFDELYNSFNNLKYKGCEEGSEVLIQDRVKNATYNDGITVVYFHGVNDSVLFQGDLTTNWHILPNSIIRFHITIGERKNIQYIRNFDEVLQSKDDLTVVKR